MKSLLLEQAEAINKLLAAEVKFHDFRDVKMGVNETEEEIKAYTELCNNTTQDIYLQAYADFEYDDDILVADEESFFNDNPIWRHSNFNRVENSKIVDSHGFSWDYAIPYYEHLKGKRVEEGDLCL